MQPCNPCGQGLPPRPLFDANGNFKVPGSVIAQNYIFRGPKGDITGTLSVFDGVLIFTGPDGVNQPISDPEGSILGEWQNITKGSYSQLSAAMQVRLINGKYSIHWLAGYPDDYREWTVDDVNGALPFTFWGLDALIPQDCPLVEVSAEEAGGHPTKGQRYFLVNAYERNDPRYLSIQQRQAVLVLTKDQNTGKSILLLNYYNVPNGFTFDNIHSANRYQRSNAPLKIATPSNTANDNNNPQEMLNQYFRTQTRFHNPQIAQGVNSSDYPGFPAMQDTLEKLKTVGIVHKSKLIDVWRMRIPNAVNPGFPDTTSFITLGPAKGRPGARLFVTGFTEGTEYAALNNMDDGWEVPYMSDNNQSKTPGETYGADYFPVESQIYLVSAITPSSKDFPKYNPAIHGDDVRLEVRIAPITPSSGYSDTFCAMTELMATIGRNTHGVTEGLRRGGAPSPLNPVRIPKTFEELQSLIDTVPVGFASLGSRQRGVVNCPINYWSYGPVRNSPGGTAPVPANDPTGINARDLKYNYVIPLANYFEPTETYTLDWYLDGPEFPDAPITGPKLRAMTGGVNSPYQTSGSRFTYVIRDFYTAPTDPRVTPYGERNDYLIFGLFNLEKSRGNKIGYIFLRGNLGPDPSYTVNIDQNFSRGYPPGYLPNVAAWAKVMEYFDSMEVTHYVIDILGGGFGSAGRTFASFFGDDRPGFEDRVSYANGDYRPQIRNTQIAAELELTGYDQLTAGQAVISCSMTAQLYPNLVRRDPKYKLYCLTSIHAVSAADIFPHGLTNPNNADPRQLGFGVVCEIIGSIDGRLQGASSAFIPLFTDENSRLKRSNGLPLTPFNQTGETGASYLRTGDNPYTLANQNPAIKPTILIDPSVRTWWFDVGTSLALDPPVPYPLNPVDGGTDPWVLPLGPGVGQPDNNNQTTWRYRFGEAALVKAMQDMELSARKQTKMTRRQVTPARGADHYLRYMETDLYRQREALEEARRAEIEAERIILPPHMCPKEDAAPKVLGLRRRLHREDYIEW